MIKGCRFHPRCVSAQIGADERRKDFTEYLKGSLQREKLDVSLFNGKGFELQISCHNREITEMESILKRALTNNVISLIFFHL